MQVYKYYHKTVPLVIRELFDLPKEIWLMCLTTEVRSTLVETDTCDTSKLVEEAEKRQNAYRAATHLRPSTIPTSDITAVRYRPTRPAQHTPPTEPFICWYYLRYGYKPNKCLVGKLVQAKNLLESRA